MGRLVLFTDDGESALEQSADDLLAVSSLPVDRQHVDPSELQPDESPDELLQLALKPIRLRGTCSLVLDGPAGQIVQELGVDVVRVSSRIV